MEFGFLHRQSYTKRFKWGEWSSETATRPHGTRASSAPAPRRD